MDGKTTTAEDFLREAARLMVDEGSSCVTVTIILNNGQKLPLYLSTFDPTEEVFD